MDERRSALEWIFDTLAAIGLVVVMVSLFVRNGYPVDIEALAYSCACGAAKRER